MKKWITMVVVGAFSMTAMAQYGSEKTYYYDRYGSSK